MFTAYPSPTLIFKVLSVNVTDELDPDALEIDIRFFNRISYPSAPVLYPVDFVENFSD